jgi:hypothetical protein
MHAPTSLSLIPKHHSSLTTMSVEQLAVRAALETISKASTQSLVSSTRELYQANFAIAEALLSLRRGNGYDADRVEGQVGGIVSSEHADLANLQTQPHATSEVGTAQDKTQSLLQKYKVRRDGLEYYPSTCGGKPCVAACRSCSPPQQSPPQPRGVDNLGIQTPTLKLSLYFISSPTDSGVASNTTVRRRHARQPRLGQPRSHQRFSAYVQESVRLCRDVQRVYPEQVATASQVVVM